MSELNGYVVVAGADTCRAMGDMHPRDPTYLWVPDYRGFDRCPWGLLDWDHYARRLPDDVAEAYARMCRSECGANTVRLVEDLEDARLLFKHAFTRDSEAELLGVKSDWHQWTCRSIKNHGLRYRGSEPFVEGFGSMLQQGLHAAPKYFEEFLPRVNEFGLLSGARDLDAYVRHYVSVTEAAVLEPVEEHLERYLYIADIFGVA